MLFHRYLALLFASAIPSSALRAKASAFMGFNYKSSGLGNVTSVQSNSTSNNTSTNCNSNATSTPMYPYFGHTADQVIKYLNLTPAAFGGYFRQTFQDSDKVPGSERSISALTYYLIRGEDGYTKWQSFNAPEVWHYYAGAPLVLVQEKRYEVNTTENKISVLGPDLFGEPKQEPQVVIPRLWWKQARSAGNWTLVGTTGE
ncbi:hypothetical protein E4U56_006553 [Claviceps arundinis]|uniref:DUF985 domain-containing protein n=1 Tax=Claviceps arundinis TaxID=1623583 RepID=A0A9P7MKA4_9HYPO|nr:hypothetical protein E4U56_006553 [Claviceps arundinis]